MYVVLWVSGVWTSVESTQQTHHHTTPSDLALQWSVIESFKETFLNQSPYGYLSIVTNAGNNCVNASFPGVLITCIGAKLKSILRKKCIM